MFLYFNTSYVTVQHPLFPLQYPSFAISIHPMLRFNTNCKAGSYYYTSFQYILCYGSTTVFDVEEPLQQEFQYILCYGSTF